MKISWLKLFQISNFYLQYQKKLKNTKGFHPMAVNKQWWSRNKSLMKLSFRCGNSKYKYKYNPEFEVGTRSGVYV